MKKLLIAAVLASIAIAPSAVLVGVAVLGAGCLPPVPVNAAPGDPTVPESTRIVMPLRSGSYSLTSGYGMREDPIRPWLTRMHWGTDLSADDGTPIVAVADGVAIRAGMINGTGQITLLHTIGGRQVASVYLHMWAEGIFIAPGQRVTAGEVIAAVGSSGYSTGPHLHLEIRPDGPGGTAVDALAWLAANNAEGIDTDPTRACPLPTPPPTPSPPATVEPGEARRGVP